MAGAVAGWLAAYGYWAVLGLVLIESLGLPVPGEITLITAGAYAGSTGRLSVGYVIAAAAIGATAGAELAYVLGRRGIGWIPADRLERGRRLMARYGWAVVVGGRFVVLLRSLLGWIAGLSRLDAGLFLSANAVGAVLWAVAYGLLGWALGESAHQFADWAGIALGGLVVLGLAVTALVRRGGGDGAGGGC
ncbi:MAG TPA: VTT domain-containing protein [Chloroflexota bacterium]